ncbi:hypothetical protein KGF54_005294 [Candida jiufengensis]|uniref:uncharacterized protein n=1 Tax=Candida jiufengensis TaxID=497108 RepID=UPI0022254E51|nr:uncharacterized protein KGF54_005294 [Candida jiufengensis]KAI5950146.1 hypothetical protein KGF54_005294 [Candida jiufengensis]
MSAPSIPSWPNYSKARVSKRTKRSSSVPTLYHGNHPPYEPITTNIETPPELQNLQQRVIQRVPIPSSEYLKSSHFKFKEGSEVASLELLQKTMNYINDPSLPLVAIDCESYEFDHEKITEIGIAILQKSDSAVPQIDTFHIIIEENIHKRSHKYVPDHKDKYMNGTSFIMSEVNAVKFVNKVFDKYLFNLSGVMIGHSISSEYKYFKKLGIDLPKDLKTIDTLKLHGISRSNGGSLWGCLRLLNIPYSFLHNAANDAYYTLLVALSYSDPSIRILKNLDVYGTSPFFGKNSSKETTNFVKVNDINLIDI